MKCPKCGINDLTFNDLSYIGNKCSQCRYQERLDKVLSKFEIDGNDIFYDNGEIFIEYFNATNCFDLGLFIKREISLDTVESLLKDLEDE